MTKEQKSQLKHKLVNDNLLKEIPKLKKSANVKRLLKPEEKQPKRKTWMNTITRDDIIQANFFMKLQDKKRIKKSNTDAKKIHKFGKKYQLFNDIKKIKLIAVFELHTNPSSM